MTNRKKRLKKGIESLGQQIKFHEEKKERAHEEGKIELENYYEKEIGILGNTRKKKKELLDK
ncbi:hypothetical protein HYS72_02025 [Candidatus Pacearchaeota archaeon]|nr:hypothetical protein [Candidatus Pacearchaeota archaeon]MBI2056906.1 hypothetical protein [Candidatus Pacearchaeota archaeon]